MLTTTRAPAASRAGSSSASWLTGSSRAAIASRTSAIPTKLSRTSPTRGSMMPPFPSAPSSAFVSSILSTTLASPTFERKNGTPYFAAKSSLMRLVEQFVTIGPRNPLRSTWSTQSAGVFSSPM